MKQGLVKKDIALASASEAAGTVTSTGPVDDILIKILSNDLQAACEDAITFIEGILGENKIDELGEVFRLLDLLQQCIINKLKPEIKYKILGYNMFFGLFKAVWHGYNRIIIGLVNCLHDCQ